MKKYIYVLIAIISVLGLYTCELFGFQYATLKIKNIPEIQKAFEVEKQKNAGLSSVYVIQLESDNVGIENNRGDKFSIDLMDLKTWTYSLEWFGYSDGIFKLVVYYGAIPVITTDSYRVQFGEILTINTIDLFKNLLEDDNNNP